MSMSFHVIGFRPPDDQWERYKQVYDACTAAGLCIPDEVNDFFNWEEPNENGIVVELSPEEGVALYAAECKEGYEVELSKLPDNVTHIRFYVSY